MSSWPNGTSKRTSPGALAAMPDSVLASEEPAASAQPGSVRIARRVLRTVVEQAALGVPGVARVADGRGGWWGLLAWSETRNGVRLDVRGDVVGINLYLIAAPGTSMVDTGTAVQEAVGAAVEHILGMGVSAINVYIQDVA
jgi:uncharacterized alkaline shock family protein YloU